MCRACHETSNGLGRRCSDRDDGFTATESAQRNRVRNLQNAQKNLAEGNAQAAANSLVHAVSAQRDLDGGRVVPESNPGTVEGPSRDLIVSPTSLDRALGKIDMMNAQRERAGQKPIDVGFTKQHRPVPGDDVAAWEQVTVRLSGVPQEELDRVAFGKDVRTSAEKVYKTEAVLQAAAASVRLSNGVYVTRRDGGAQSTPAQVEAYLADSPGGPVRTAMKPNTGDDFSNAVHVRMWVSASKPSSDYGRAVRKSVMQPYMPARDVGTATSAISGYLRAQQQQAAPSASTTSGQSAPPPRPQNESRWLGSPGQKIVMPARVEAVHELQMDRPDINWNKRPEGEPHYLYIFRTPEGDSVRWLASRTQGLRKGDSVTLQGTVKDHSKFRGERQTEMFYCDVAIHV